MSFVPSGLLTDSLPIFIGIAAGFSQVVIACSGPMEVERAFGEEVCVEASQTSSMTGCSPLSRGCRLCILVTKSD